MRIISGKYKGLRLNEYNIEGTRPTMDRVKESLFAMIQNDIKNKVCLDLFSGSGSLGIEALSNGSKKCIFVDSNKLVTDTLKKNLTNIKEGYNIYNMDYKKALEMFHQSRMKFDIVFLDPPYKLNYITPSIKKLLELNLLNDNAYIICEYMEENIDTNLNIYKEKKYGSKYIKIYKL